jgi:hypothetical protein
MSGEKVLIRQGGGFIHIREYLERQLEKERKQALLTS